MRIAAPRRLRSNGEMETVEVDAVAGGAAKLDPDRMFAAVMAQLDGASVLGGPTVAPLHERDEDRQQLDALLREDVAHAFALAGVLVLAAFEQAVVDELAEARRGRGLADADSCREVVETRRSVERLAE